MHHLDLCLPERSYHPFDPPWAPPFPTGHSIQPLQLPTLRDPLAYFPASSWNKHQDFSGHPDLPSSVPRPQHDPRRTWNYSMPSLSYQHSLHRLKDLSNPLSHHDVGDKNGRAHPLTICPIPENQLLRSTVPSRELLIPKTTKRRRRRSHTVSAIPSRDINSKTSDDPVQLKADDKLIMLSYYTEMEEPKKKRMRKASSSGTLGNYIALASEPDKPELIAQLPKRDLPMLKGFEYLKLLGQQITRSSGLREPVSICADDNTERAVPEDVPPVDYDSDEPPPLVIDLAEGEDAPLDQTAITDHEQGTTSTISPVCEDTSQETLPDLLPIEEPPASERQTDSPPSYFSPVQRALLPTVASSAPLIPSTITSSTSADQSTTNTTTPPVPSIVRVGKFQCKRCHDCFTSISLLVKHRSVCLTRPDPSQRLMCTQCNMPFSSSKACSDHWKEYHSTERPHQCQKCGRRFTLARALEKHSWTHQ